jgi:hypothetical protein
MMIERKIRDKQTQKNKQQKKNQKKERKVTKKKDIFLFRRHLVIAPTLPSHTHTFERYIYIWNMKPIKKKEKIRNLTKLSSRYLSAADDYT